MSRKLFYALFLVFLIPLGAHAVDQCNNTTKCKNKFGSPATDCKDSKSPNSVCMCGTRACDTGTPSSVAASSKAVSSTVVVSSIAASSIAASSIAASSIPASSIAASSIAVSSTAASSSSTPPTDGYDRKISVKSLNELNSAIANALPGDGIILANGTYNSPATIKVDNKKGTKEKPIVIRAETIGGVTITGEAGFDLGVGTQYVVIKGFVFKHKAVTGGPNKASYSKFTQNVYELTPNGSNSTSYLKVFGAYNEVSYNTFRNKKFQGPILSLQGLGANDMSPGNWVHHNHFVDFPSRSDNDNAAVQPGYHDRRHAKAFLMVEHNLFENMNADAEGVMSAKAWNVTFRYNTVRNSKDTNFRNGNESLAYGNYFIGGSGLRFSGSDHKIYNNTFVNVGDAIKAFSRKDSNPDHDNGFSHQPPDRAFVGFNTFIGCSKGFIHGGDGGSTGIMLVNNIFSGCAKAVEHETRGAWRNPKIEGNITWNSPAGNLPTSGFQNINPLLTTDALGVPTLQAGSPAIGRALGNYAFVTEDVQRQARGTIKDIGSDQFSSSAIINKVLTAADVGPFAKDAGK